MANTRLIFRRCMGIDSKAFMRIAQI